MTTRIGRRPHEPHRLYRSGEVQQILGLTRRQLAYWAQTGLVRPSGRSAGGHARYDFRDLIALRAAKRLLQEGLSLQRLRSTIRALRRLLPGLRHPLGEVVLVATGDLVLAFHGGAALDVATGQEWIFSVADLEGEIERWKRRALARPLPARMQRVPSRTASQRSLRSA